MGDRVDPHEPVEQRLEQIQPQRVLRVALGKLRLLVDFHEHAVHTGGDAGRGHRFDELGLAGGHAVARSRQLQAVRDVVHDRKPEPPHDREDAHVDHEVVVPEAEATFGDDHLPVSGGGDLFDRMPHVGGREELTLLEVDDAAGAGRRDDQVSLAHEEGRNLKDVSDLGGAGRLPGLVDVGQDRYTSRFPNARKDTKPLVDAGATERPCGSSVGFVERGLEDVLHPRARRDVAHGQGEADRVRFALDHAGTGNQEQRTNRPRLSVRRTGSASRRLTYHGRGRLLSGGGVLWP